MFVQHRQLVTFLLALAGCLSGAQYAAGEPREEQPRPGSSSRYEDPAYRRGSAVQPLKEIVNLPNAFVDDLNELIRRAKAAANTEVDVSTEGLKVKYFSGVGTAKHGLMDVGSPPPGLPGEPPAGKWVREHCSDANGLLVKTIVRKEDGTRTVDSVFLYEGGKPACRLRFNNGTCGGGRFGLYRNGKLVLVAGISAEGRVLSCEVIFYVEDREDYTVYYRARRTTEPFALADLYLQSISMTGASRIDFNEKGELKDLWSDFPPRAPQTP